MRGMWHSVCEKCGWVLEWHQPRSDWLMRAGCVNCGANLHKATPAEEKAIALLPKDENGRCRLVKEEVNQ